MASTFRVDRRLLETSAVLLLAALSGTTACSDPQSGPDPAPVVVSGSQCGDGVIDEGELCDDGNNVGGDGCGSECDSDETCGNDVVDPHEVCDDGNTESGDGCSADCRSQELCGNSIVDVTEECDDGNRAPRDECTPDCRIDKCGDGKVDPGEACDDGNRLSGDGCAFDCDKLEICGDGIEDALEECDDGVANGDAPNACRATCTRPFCGDGVLDDRYDEECDDGEGNSDDVPGACRTSCRRHRCGDGVVDPDEDCEPSTFAGATCAEFGKNGTDVFCDASCEFDEEGCFLCGDGRCTALESVSTCPTECAATDLSGFSLTMCAVRADASVWCWGRNSYGMLGDGTISDFVDRPQPVPSLSDVAQVEAGQWHTCARKNDGTVWCWGSNIYGDLGDGNFDFDDNGYPNPRQVMGINDAATLTVGGWTSCALDSAGEPWCWGRNNGQIPGADGFQTTAFPLQLPESISQISVGYTHTCATSTTGKVLCFGQDSGEGRLGTGTTVQGVTTVGPLGSATMVSAGSWHTCALLADQTVWCWGHNADGNLGDGTYQRSFAPVMVQNLPASKYVAAGGRHACALSVDDDVWCWGDGTDGALGFGGNGDSLRPVQAQVGAPVLEVTASLSFNLWSHHSCALTTDGVISCWGNNEFGTLGDGNSPNASWLPAPALSFEP